MNKNFQKKGIKFFSVFLTLILIIVTPSCALSSVYADIDINSDDTTPPAFDGTPVFLSNSDGTRKVSIYFKALEEAYYYFILVPDDDPTPTKEQVVAGLDANGNPALDVKNSRGSKYISMSTGATAPMHDTNYDIYLVLQDDAGNTSEPVKIDVKSPAPADFIVSGYPKVGDAQADSSKQVNVLIKVQNTEKSGKAYWVLVTDGEPKPTIEQIAEGKDNTGSLAMASGNLELNNNTESKIIVTGQNDNTEYDFYMVVGDTRALNPLSNCSDIVKLDIVTPDKDGEKVCEINGKRYNKLIDALEIVKSGETIKLLKNIDYNFGIEIDNKKITFDLNNFILNIFNATGGALVVKNSGSVELIGTGEFNVKSFGGSAVSAYANSSATVTNAKTTHIYARGAYAEGSDSKITVLGDVEATGFYGYGVQSWNGGNIIVDGTVSSKWVYVGIDSVQLTKPSGTSDPEKPNYIKYSWPDTESVVWIKGEDTTPPYITSIFPGENNAPTSGNIKIKFNEPMDSNLGTIILGRDGEPNIDVKVVGWSDNNMTYTVSYDSLLPNTKYNITLSGFADISGNALKISQVINFITSEDSKVYYVLTVEKGNGSGNYEAGESVNIIADEAPYGKVFDRWITNNGGTFNDVTSPSAIYTMPSANVIVTATYKDISGGNPTSNSANSVTYYTIEVVKNNKGEPVNGIVTVNKDRVSAGNTITITVKPNDGYELENIIVLDKNDKKVTIKDNSNGNYTFTMPQSNVKIIVTFKKIQVQLKPLPFIDVEEDDWYYDAVAYTFHKNILNGTSDTIFSPNDSMTRAMMVTILYRLTEEPEAGTSNFVDVPVDAWYSKAVAWAADKKIIKGIGNNQFAPNRAITREEIAVIMENYAKAMEHKLPVTKNATVFNDNSSISLWAVNAIKSMQQADIINGIADNLFYPKGEATRAEVAAILMRYIEIIVK